MENGAANLGSPWPRGSKEKEQEGLSKEKPVGGTDSYGRAEVFTGICRVPVSGKN